MVVRVLVSVLLAAALLGYALPAVEEAHTSRADILAREELGTLGDVTEQFVTANDAASPGVAGASRVVEVRVPRGTTLAVGVGPRDESLAWTRSGRAGWVGRVETDVAFDGSLRLREAGTHRLALALVRADGGLAVRVRTVKRNLSAVERPWSAGSLPAPPTPAGATGTLTG